LDKKTGQDVWRADRDEKSNWATPYVWRNKLRTELVTAGGTQMRSYDPKTGELLWSINGNGRTATTPVGDSELLYVDSYDRLTGAGGVIAAIRPGAAGDISLKPNETSNAHVAWSVAMKGGYRMASPAICKGCIYFLEHQAGIVHCFDAATGNEHYRKRLPGAAGFAASPIVSDDKVYCVDQNCMTHVLGAGPELRVVAANELGEMCWSSPAVAGESLILRTIDHLYAVGQRSSN
jgi:outer membrane protein assembly factor BamB